MQQVKLVEFHATINLKSTYVTLMMSLIFAKLDGVYNSRIGELQNYELWINRILESIS